MKFVMFGLMGVLVVVMLGYLWFVPIHEIADQFVVGYGIAIDNIGAQIFTAPRNSNPKSSGEEPARYEVDESRIPFPRPRRRSTTARAATQAAIPSPANSVEASSGAATTRPTPTLRATTIETGAVQQTEIYVDLSGEKTVIRAKDGEVIEAIGISEK